MFDFINDDERIIFTAVVIIAIVVVVGFIFLIIKILKTITGFFLSKKRMEMIKSQNSILGEGNEFDVFISYSHRDESVGIWLADELRKEKIRVFLSSSELSAGDNFSEGIKDALRDTKELWLIASPHSLDSEWVMTEWGAAWAMGKRVVPVLHNCLPGNLPERLAALQTISLDELGSEIARLKTRTEGNILP